LRLDFLPVERLRAAPPFFRPPLLAAAMMTLHDEVEHSTIPSLKSLTPHRVLTVASYQGAHCDDDTRHSVQRVAHGLIARDVREFSEPADSLPDTASKTGSQLAV
jgi:hypothetical protein